MKTCRPGAERQVAMNSECRHSNPMIHLAETPSWGLCDMKGTGATDMWPAGVPLKQIQVLCGHDLVTTTERHVKSHWRGIVAPNKVLRAV